MYSFRMVIHGSGILKGVTTVSSNLIKVGKLVVDFDKVFDYNDNRSVR